MVKAFALVITLIGPNHVQTGYGTIHGFVTREACLEYGRNLAPVSSDTRWAINCKEETR